MSNSIKIHKCILQGEKIDVELEIETDLKSIVLGCTLRDTYLNEDDIQHIFLKESKYIVLELALDENQLDKFCKKWDRGTLMLAIWKDDTFTERLCDTGWIKIESYIDKLLDEERIKDASVKKLKSDGCDNFAGIDYSKMTAKYMMELRDKIWKELLGRIPEENIKEIRCLLNEDKLDNAAKLILENVADAEKISKNIIEDFRSSGNIH